MNKEYKIKNTRILYDGFFNLKELNLSYKKHNGSWSPNIKREIFGGAHVATVLPYDPKKKKIVLLQQFRPGVLKRKDNPIIIEIVAGLIDKNEKPSDAAKRECFEETGCKIKKISKIHSYYPAPGSSESFYHLFLGEVDSFEGEKILGQKDENEDILVKSFSIIEVQQLLKQKKIINGLTLIALQWFFLDYYSN